MIKKGYKGDSLLVHLDVTSEDHYVRKDSLVMLFRNHGRHRLYPYIQREQIKKEKLKPVLLVQ